uniref:Uncharacterized protein TCIL3000_8_6100 n=1 Tax=Trypanosoma congolense (strain IL3000) TaxID=1068625 RepID=G0USM0_TRYCI|nr:unnamed protein product [Trypanosoma congolense IL3000]
MESHATEGAETDRQHQEDASPVSEAAEVAREKVSALLDENMRLQAKTLQLQDQVAELRRQLLSEKAERQGLGAELSEVRESLHLSRNQLDQQKREKSELSLQLCSAKAEKEELEERLSEAWNNVASIQQAANEKDAVNKSLHDTIDCEKREHDAQKVLMSALVAQLSSLENQLVAGSYAEDQQRRLNEETLQNVEGEILRFSQILEELADNIGAPVGVNMLLERHRELPQLHLAVDEGVVTTAADAAVGREVLNISTKSESFSTVGTRLLGPAYQALKYLKKSLQQQLYERHNLQQEQRVLEAHIDSLKEEIRQVCNDCDGVRERLMRSESQRARAEASLHELRQLHEEEKAQMTATRHQLAKLLQCMDDWYMIEHCISDNMQEMTQLRHDVEESRRLHEQYVMHREEEVDDLVNSHQQDVQEQKRQLERLRRECERYKRAAAVSGSSNTFISPAGLVSIEAEDSTAIAPKEQVVGRDVIQEKYDELKRYVEMELEPLINEQAKVVKKEKQRVDELSRLNDELQLELKLFSGVRGRGISSGGNKEAGNELSMFEAFILVLRVLSGMLTDMREMTQQRKALMRYIIAYEGRYGTLNDGNASPCPHPLLCFRKAVVAVLAANRLVAIHKSSWHYSGKGIPNSPYGDVVLLATRGTLTRPPDMRIRLPQETCCIARGGLVRLPFHQVLYPGNEEGVLQTLKSKGYATFVMEQELQHILRLPPVPRDVKGEAASQSYTIRSLVDSLVAFVTVPSALRPPRNFQQPTLWQGLTKGLRAVQATRPLQTQQRCRQQGLQRLPPRPPSVVVRPPPQSYNSLNDAAAVVSSQSDTTYGCWPGGGGRGSEVGPRELPSSLLQPSSLREPRSGVEKVYHIPSVGSYPVPQPLSDDSHNDESLEEALRLSLIRDVQESSGLQESQLGEGFASHILGVIQALDQRVTGALERSSKVRLRR